jgi:hypothetical protein
LASGERSSEPIFRNGRFRFDLMVGDFAGNSSANAVGAKPESPTILRKPATV